MNKTTKTQIPIEDRIAVNQSTLASMLDCGLATAKKIGVESGARIQIGSRVLYRADRVREYLEQIAEA